jgi:DNA topoisomerase-1
LIRELEHKGIGRPSTFASLIEVLTDKIYVEKKDIQGYTVSSTTYTLTPDEWPPTSAVTQSILGADKGKLVPTEIGNSVIGFCIREFPQLFAYEFTAQMEKRLDTVSRGEESWKQVCRDTWASYKEAHDRLKDSASAPHTSEKVKDFGDGFKAVMSKKGPLLVQESAVTTGSANEGAKPTFYSFPPGSSLLTITVEEAKAWIAKLATDSLVGEIDGKPVHKKKGPYGFYLEYNSLRIPFVDTDTPEQIAAKFAARKTASTATRIGPYHFAVGQYGPYMFKEGLKTRKFVSIPSTVDVKKLTVAEADALYALKPSTSSSSGRGGRGGRGRGGRGGRGRGS